ncbi:MAG: alpha-E domain-containing protein [Cucumibacter sp.]
MLGRNAANLFWLSRYMERAENMARLLDVAYRMAITAGTAGGGDHLRSMLQAAAVDKLYDKKHAETALATVAHFMLFDRENPSSVGNCLLNARSNARSVRVALTQDMWSSLNDAWMEFERTRPNTITANRLPAFLGWIKQAAHQFRGALLSTHLRNDGYCFAQFGNFIERGDNTARILDVKYYVLLPRSDPVGGEVDIHQWTMILRAASAHRSYRHVYHDRYRAFNIAEFLILKREMPRSLAFCHDWIASTMIRLDGLYGERTHSHDIVDRMGQTLFSQSMESIFQSGLHEFLSDYIDQNSALNQAIAVSYNFP